MTTADITALTTKELKAAILQARSDYWTSSDVINMITYRRLVEQLEAEMGRRVRRTRRA